MPDFLEHLLPTPTCVVAFGSGDRETVVPGVPNYEFANSLRELGVSYVLMHDGSHTWYEGGIVGIGDKNAVAAYIAALKKRYAWVITTGSSFGAYGALLYGQLAPADEVIAISPLTVLGPSAVAEFEQKWHHRINSPDDLDLKPLFTEGLRAKVKAFVTDGDGAELDLHMTQRLGITDITLIPGHAHGALARHMRDTGMFKDLFT